MSRIFRSFRDDHCCLERIMKIKKTRKRTKMDIVFRGRKGYNSLRF